MTPAELLHKFDQWLSEASEESIRENCRTEGTVFFNFMQARGVFRGDIANLVQSATGYNARWVWRNANPATVRHALEAYFYSRQYIELTEAEVGYRLNSQDAFNMSIPFWRLS